MTTPVRYSGAVMMTVVGAALITSSEGLEVVEKKMADLAVKQIQALGFQVDDVKVVATEVKLS